MAEFFAPQLDNMAFLRNALGMQQFQQQGQMAPLRLAEAQQQVQSGQLNLDMMRQMMAMKEGLYRRIMSPQGSPAPGTQQAGAQNVGGVAPGVGNGPQASVSYQPPQGNVPEVPPLPFSPETMQAVGMLAPEMAKGLSEGQAANRAAREDAINRNAMALQPAVDELKNVISSPAPQRLLMNNQMYMAAWRANAPRLGLDPAEPANMTPDNIRAVATLAHNDLAARSYGKIPTLPMPTKWRQVDVGYGGTQQVNDLTGETKPGLGREIPTATQEKVTLPDGTQVLRSIPTGGMDVSGRPLALSGGNAGATGAPPAGGRNLGMAPADAEAKKAAQFANYMIPALKSLNRIESSGYVLPPAARSMIINAATSEDTGALHSLLQQESLKHLLGEKGQEYMAALMPVLQAAGHSMGGARLTAGQMRANFESIVPVDTNNANAMQEVNQNRESYLRGLVASSGAAAYAPAYRATVGALADSYKNGGLQHPTVGQVVKGYKYIGGPPGKQSSWEKAGG